MLPEEDTHFSDAADKIVWTKFGEKLKDKGGSFVPARVGKCIFSSKYFVPLNIKLYFCNSKKDSMITLLVKLAKLGPNQENLVDIEIDLPNNYTNNDLELIKSIIKSPDNLDCDISIGASPKLYKGDLAIVLIININSGQQIMRQYEFRLTGKLCSNLKGEECLLNEWPFILNTNNSSVLNHTSLNFQKIF